MVGIRAPAKRRARPQGARAGSGGMPGSGRPGVGERRGGGHRVHHCASAGRGFAVRLLKPQTRVGVAAKRFLMPFLLTH
jgi:hypothetical protein